MTTEPKHRILPGSFEIDGSVVTAGVHTGKADFDPTGLRYIKVDTAGVDPATQLIDLLGQVYDNSTGCLAIGDFKVND